MGSELDDVMCQAWEKIKDKVLGDEAELRRRLARREKVFDRVPRALCLAIRASDYRINPQTALLSPPSAMNRGELAEHDVLITSSLLRDLCRPVELCWRLKFSQLAEQMGCYRQLPRALELRGILPGHRIPGIGGNWHNPYPLVASGYPPFLDPCALGKAAPDELLLPFWRDLNSRLPDNVRQTLRRQPVFQSIRRQQRFMRWTWVCPACKRNANTLYFPMGSPNWAAAHNIKLPEVAWYDPPHQPGCFACRKCHHVICLARTSKGISGYWSILINHMSGGLLFGREVQRPASFTVARKKKPFTLSRPSPRRDELEHYLAHTDLPLLEIARRMGWTRDSIKSDASRIYRKRAVKGGRPALKQWWTTKLASEQKTTAAA